MHLRFTTDSQAAPVLDVDIKQLVIAGWVGRDQAAVLHHIRELEALGVPAPGAVPLFYRVATQQLAQHSPLEVVGEQTSGEAEPFVFFHRGEYWVSLISDHTDRHLETFSVALSKQACVKPVAGHAWRMAEVEPHWDRLELRAWIKVNGDWVTYQQGTQ